MQGRMHFPGNPWSEGHPIATFVWSGRIDESRGLVFDLHLKTANYYAERDIEDDEMTESDWASPGAWANYHACTLSSTQWGSRGWVVGTTESPLCFGALGERVQRVDTLEEREFDLYDLEDRTFHIYLLGHDDVADHSLRFAESGHGHSLHWKGRIALAYVGDYAFRYAFEAKVEGIRFDGFSLPDHLSDSAAASLFSRLCSDAERFALDAEGRRRAFRLL